MKYIQNPDNWMRGKTIKKIDCQAVNCNTIFFEDGTAVYLDAEPVVQGIYGPVWYEIDPNKPVHEQ